MVDGADADGWSQVAAGWAELWGAFGDPLRRRIADVAAIGRGTTVLDAGCGAGEFLALLTELGARAVGADPAPEMVRIARGTGAEVVEADIENLPFAEGKFDVATAVNALQFADDTTAALREMARVVRSGGLMAIANWAEASRNDVDVIEAAVAVARDEDPLPGGPLRSAGGLEEAFAAAGLQTVDAGIVDLAWHTADAETLVRGILLGEDDEVIAELGPVVVAAAAPFRRDDAGYTLHNAFRWATARVDGIGFPMSNE